MCNRRVCGKSSGNNTANRIMYKALFGAWGGGGGRGGGILAPSFAAIERLRALDIDTLDWRSLPKFYRHAPTRATRPVRTRRDPFTPINI